ncbi:unnamed protein product [Closterium sp. Naga37s-1]|nr:unnamed protein product [Closterium sp. Naga37s-1]
MDLGGSRRDANLPWESDLTGRDRITRRDDVWGGRGVGEEPQSNDRGGDSSWGSVGGSGGAQERKGWSSFLPSSFFQPRRAAETDSLPADVRDQAIKGVEQAGRSGARSSSSSAGGREKGVRVTVGDVAAASGLKVTEAEKALKAPAADAEGFLEVSNKGDVVYVLPSNLSAAVAQRSLWLKLKPWIDNAKSAASYVVRVAFGTALLASILIVYTAISVLLSSRRCPARLPLPPYSTPVLSSSLVLLVPAPHSFAPSPVHHPHLPYPYSNIPCVCSICPPRPILASLCLAPFAVTRTVGTAGAGAVGNILYTFPLLQRTAGDLAGKQRKQPSPALDPVQQTRYFAENLWTFSEAPAWKRTLAAGLGVVNVVGVVWLSSLLSDPAIVREAGVEFVQLISSLMPWLQGYAAVFVAIPAVRYLWLQLEIANKTSELTQKSPSILPTPLPLRTRLPIHQGYATVFFAIPAVRYLWLQRANETIALRNSRRQQSALQLAQPNAQLRRKPNAQLRHKVRRRGRGGQESGRPLFMPSPYTVVITLSLLVPPASPYQLAYARQQARSTVVSEDKVIYTTAKDLANAREQARSMVVSEDKVIYTTAKDVAEQDLEAREWERKLEGH